MLIKNADGSYTAGPHDVLLILHHVVNRTYHAAVFEGAQLPTAHNNVRLLKLQHTAGVPSLREALTRLNELAAKIHTAPENIWHNKPPYPWNGRQGITLIVHDWKTPS